LKPFLAACLVALTLAACTNGGGLAPGLVARMDIPGAQLDKAEAINIINQLRTSKNTSPLVLSANLNAKAQSLAEKYAQTGNAPKRPKEAKAMRVSAGYANFAETFSGWRGTKADANALADENYKKAGLGVAYSATSTYGVYWVLLLGENDTQ